jgi:hypothetical protein
VGKPKGYQFLLDRPAPAAIFLETSDGQGGTWHPSQMAQMADKYRTYEFGLADNIPMPVDCWSQEMLMLRYDSSFARMMEELPV